jgi:hypothetical protein
MEDEPDFKYFKELLERRRSSADLSESIAVEKEEAIAPMSASYAQSI